MVDTQRYPILSILEDAKVPFDLIEHAPVFTVQEGKEILGFIPGAGTKNLFLCDKKAQRFALLFVEETKRVALKELRNLWNWDKVSFGSAEHLRECLGVEPGSVTPMAMFSQEASRNMERLKFYYDKDLLLYEQIQMHPMINSATVVVNPKRFLEELFKKHDISHSAMTIPVI